MRGVFAAAFAVSIVTAAHDARADTYCSFARCTYLSRPPSFMGFDVGFVWTRFANTTTANAAPFTGQAFRADWRTMTRHRVVFGAEFDWGHVGGGAQQTDRADDDRGYYGQLRRCEGGRRDRHTTGPRLGGGRDGRRRSHCHDWRQALFGVIGFSDRRAPRGARPGRSMARSFHGLRHRRR